MPTTDDDDVLNALDAVVAAINENAAAQKVLLRRAKALKAARSKGVRYRDIVPAEERPLIVELLREQQDRLNRAGGAFRVAEARALRAEGLTFDEIARLFGVTRQRVIALVNVDRTPSKRRATRRR